jgi:hypothetical protein
MENEIILPKTQELIDKLKEQPTTTERINALESAISDIAMMIMGD